MNQGRFPRQKPVSPTVCLCVLLVGALFRATGTEILVYPRPVSELDRRSDYPVQLLSLALTKTGGDFTLIPSPQIMNKARVAAELLNGRIDVGWMVTNRQREEDLYPIRICIFKGLGGWRVGLIRKGDEARFQTVKTAEDLRLYSVGQQADWPDTEILTGYGIPVVTTTTYDSLFKMLTLNRFDWFLRNIMEVWEEANAWKASDIVVEPRLLVRYPSAYYFFVSKENADLGERIEKGLEAALKDRSFDGLFREIHGNILELTRVKDRLILDIPNPLLPPLTPLHRSDLWYQGEPGGPASP